MDFEVYHDEVVSALRSLGNDAYGAAIAKDRKSSMEYLGIGFPVLRARVKGGFSFSAFPDDLVLAIWDHLWKVSTYGDVLFAALETYIPIARARKSARLWPVARDWLPRVDNWCHADKLGSLYSYLLESDPESVLPVLTEWNEGEGEWERRVSLVSLIHYSGTNAVFLAPGQMLALVANCVGDPRHYVQTAVGWVLREMRRKYPGDVDAFLAEHESRMPGATLRRAKGF